VPFFFPPNVTDLLQPVDHHLAQQLKKQMADLLDQRLLEDEAFANEWLGVEEGTMPAWKVRVVLSKLAGEAWEHVCARRNFVKLFQETGCLMPKLGASTEGIAPVKIQGVTNYSFELATGQAAAPIVAPPSPLPPLHEDQLISEDEGEEAETARAAGANTETETSDSSVSNASQLPTPVVQGVTPLTNDEEDAEDKLEVDVDVNTDRDELADETADESVWGAGSQPVAPSGFAVADKPVYMPAARTILSRKVLWAIPVTASGAPGWIVSAVGGGPLTPSSAMWV